MEKRLKYIDALKGFSILLVVLGHIIFEKLYANQILHVSSFNIFHNTINYNYSIFFNFICSFHMPIFFIISGFLIHHNFQNEHLSPNYKKSAKQLLIPYIIFSILAISINFFVDYLLGEKYIDTLFKNIFYTIIFDGFSALWFLPTLFISKNAFLFIKKYLNQKQEWILYILLTIITYTFSLSYNYYFWINNTITIKTAFVLISNIINRSLIGTIFIMIGYISYDFIKNIPHKLFNIIIYVVIILINTVLSLFNEGVDLHYSIINNPLLYYYLAISTSLSLIFIFKVTYSKFFTPLEFLGRNSLIILCTHYPFQIIRILSHYINTNSKLLNSTLIFVFTLAIEIVIIYIIKIIKEKTVRI